MNGGRLLQGLAALHRTPLRAIRRLQRALSHEIWNIGLVAQTAADILAHGIIMPVQWFPPLPGFAMLADPACCIDDNGGLSIFAEYLAYRAQRGEIWHAHLPAGGPPATARFLPLLRGPFHLSYPAPFGDDKGGLWLAAESWQSGAVPVWHRTGNNLVPAAPWLPGRQPVDPTILYHNSRWYLFCTFHDDAPDARLHVFHAERLDGQWVPLPDNPVRCGLFGSRPAGPIFAAGEHLIRPGQDCSVTYGGGVVLHRVSRLDPQGFQEEVVRRLAPVAGPYGAGLHTICPAGVATLIDGKRLRMDLTKPLRRMHKRLLT
jgi:hypothetical protein